MQSAVDIAAAAADLSPDHLEFRRLRAEIDAADDVAVGRLFDEAHALADRLLVRPAKSPSDVLLLAEITDFFEVDVSTGEICDRAIAALIGAVLKVLGHED